MDTGSFPSRTHPVVPIAIQQTSPSGIQPRVCFKLASITGRRVAESTGRPSDPRWRLGSYKVRYITDASTGTRNDDKNEGMYLQHR